MRATSANMSMPRRLGVSVAAVTALAGLGACSESAGPEQGEVTTEDLQQIEDDLGALEDRINQLEAADPAADSLDDDDGDLDEVLDDPNALIGQDVTVSAAVSEVVVSGDNGIAFMIGDDSGEPIAVLSASPTELQVDDLVRVSGTVTTIQRDTFEEDFGLAEDELFDDPDAFFSDHEGEAALSADSVEVLQEQADG